MKEFFSLFLFAIGALCFVVFFTALNPAVVTAAVAPAKPGHCSTEALPMLTCRLHLLAAAWWPDVWQ
jgi:hypothetical protein